MNSEINIALVDAFRYVVPEMILAAVKGALPA